MDKESMVDSLCMAIWPFESTTTRTIGQPGNEVMKNLLSSQSKNTNLNTGFQLMKFKLNIHKL